MSTLFQSSKENAVLMDDSSKLVRFSKINVREYEITLGHNPGCKRGPPIGIGSGYIEKDPVDINVYEKRRNKRRTRDELYTDCHERRSLLQSVGFSVGDILAVEQEVARTQKARKIARNAYFAGRQIERKRIPV
uniref:Uncharacterized protein n=1 Tax=Helicotheca tamesis TaxID=374047 RepID=A0A7S2MEV5_9STRA|mmetsp:Transcript_14949/g.20371  ORF Transcript_14949/g.20371 Transcript_14949/m.20371 type:complete len:134 (+) Transcript_14949:100-501(+)